MEVKRTEAAQLRTQMAQEAALIERKVREARALSQQAAANRSKAEREYAAGD